MDASITESGKFDTALFDHLVQVVSSDGFLQSKGLNNEVPFYICPYDPDQTRNAADLIPRLVSNLARRGVSVGVVDLYDIALELLQERDVLNAIIAGEAEIGKANLGELLRGVLDAQEHLVPAIEAKVRDQQIAVLFVTGVGEVFPYIRTHTLLNNMQSHFKQMPVVLFFPGGYHHDGDTGSSLDLFNLLHEDHYYRAFNIRAVHARA